MTVYTWMVLLLLLAALIFRGNKKGSIAFILIAFLILFTVMGLRDVNSVGQDASGAHGSYPLIFQRTGQKDWSKLVGSSVQSFNTGFSLLMKLVYVLTNGDYQLFVTIISLFVVFSYMRFIRKYSPSPIQSVLYFLGLLYFLLMFDALKQAVAMAVLLFAFDAIFENKPIKFVLLVLIAAQFHFPAMVFLPAYWISKMKMSRSFIVLLGFLLIVTYIFREQILNLMLKVYGGDDVVGGSLSDVRFIRTKVLVMLLIVVAAVILRPPTEGDTLYNTCLYFVGISIVFQTFCGYNNIFERLADYYFHTSIVMIPLVFEKCELDRHFLDEQMEMTVKTVAPVAFCAFAVWRFLSYVGSSPYYMDLKLIWQ